MSLLAPAIRYYQLSPVDLYLLLRPRILFQYTFATIFLFARFYLLSVKCPCEKLASIGTSLSGTGHRTFHSIVVYRHLGVLCAVGILRDDSHYHRSRSA